MTTRITILAGVCCALLMRSHQSAASCADPADDSPLVVAGSLTSALLPVGPHPKLERTVVTYANSLRVRKTSDLTADGGVVTLTGNAQNSPNPVQLDGGDYAVFVGTSTGRVHRIDPTTRTIVWTVDLQTGSCSSDRISATPVVHLRRFATSTFKAAYADDIIYVATSYGCTAGKSNNRVYALNAETGAEEWAFNAGAAVAMDAAYADPYLDYASDRLLIATDRRASTSQHSLWSIDVVTGGKSWSANVGQVYTAPVVRGSRVYVASLYGEIKALNYSDGAPVWSVSNGGIPITTNIFVEFRAPYDDLIGAIDYYGNVWLVRDDGLTGSTEWKAAPGMASATSRPAFDAGHGKIYVGADDGKVYQMNITDGSTEASREVDKTATVGVPTLVFEDTDANGSLDDVRMIAGSDSGEIAKFCYPWTAEVSPVAPLSSSFAPNPGTCNVDTDCGSGPNQCSEWKCISKVCSAQPIKEGGGCDDGNGNTSGDTCHSGTCAGTSDCQTSFDSCICKDDTGSTVQRKLFISEPLCKNPGIPGFDIPDWCGRETSNVKTHNTCIGAGDGSFAVVSVDLFDNDRVPFTGANVSMTIMPGDGTPPSWKGTGKITISTETGEVIESSRRGTYYALLTSPPSGDPTGNVPAHIQVTAQKVANSVTCVNDEFSTELAPQIKTGGGSKICGVDGITDQAGYLRVTVVDDFGAPVKDAPVLVGWDFKDETKYFYKTYAEFLAYQTPSLPHFDRTDNFGVVEFIDAGNNMNGPLNVRVGKTGDQDGTGIDYTVKKSVVTLTAP